MFCCFSDSLLLFQNHIFIRTFLRIVNEASYSKCSKVCFYLHYPPAQCKTAHTEWAEKARAEHVQCSISYLKIQRRTPGHGGKNCKPTDDSTRPTPAGTHETEFQNNNNKERLCRWFANNILYLNSLVVCLSESVDSTLCEDSHRFTDGRLLILFGMDLLGVSKQFHNAEAVQYMAAKRIH